jgi:hypothetical protein
MSLDTRAKAGTRPGPPHADPAASKGVRALVRDLAMGIRFAVGGGREGWTRTLLTAVGVGLGVALLLGAASVPDLLQNRDARSADRQAADMYMYGEEGPVKRSDSTVLVIDANTDFRDSTVSGRLLRPDGGHPVLPPGVSELPKPGDMIVSPALRDLMNSSEGKLLKERFDRFHITGTIGDAGLVGPKELYYYAGSDTLSTGKGGAHRTGDFGTHMPKEPFNPLLIVLVVLICVVLLTPVMIFIGTAVRFGGERRDRRLAALRLVGADARGVRRIAAGEALFGSLLGLVAGAGFFLLIRQLIGVIDVDQINAFPSDVVPMPALAALIVLAVPVTAVVVTLVSLRAVAIEPLGVFRHSTARRRRLWWRLALPVIGIAILLSTERVNSGTEVVNVTNIAGGATLTLIGFAALLPWLVEVVVSRLRGGPVPWQLATRRLQLSSGAAARAVSGITVAVAGAVALQMLFASMHDDFNSTTDMDPHRAQLSVTSSKASGTLAQRMIEDFRSTKGVEGVIGRVTSYVVKPGELKPSAEDIRPTTELSVGTCATLRELAHVKSCEDGDAFVVHSGMGDEDEWVDQSARPGKPVDLNTSSWNDYPGERRGKHIPWTLPKSAHTVTARTDPAGDRYSGIYATPGAIDVNRMVEAETRAMVQIDRQLPDAEEYVRNTAARIDPLMTVSTIRAISRDKQYATVARGLQIGAMATMALIASSMLVSMIEQLRERRRLLASLTALGTRRTSMGLSLLWQTALPVALGLAVAVTGGLALGAVMVRMIRKSVTDWWVFLPLVGAGAAMVAVVTLLSLPPLWRMMRPDGLRTE